MKRISVFLVFCCLGCADKTGSSVVDERNIIQDRMAHYAHLTRDEQDFVDWATTERLIRGARVPDLMRADPCGVDPRGIVIYVLEIKKEYDRLKR